MLPTQDVTTARINGKVLAMDELANCHVLSYSLPSLPVGRGHRRLDDLPGQSLTGDYFSPHYYDHQPPAGRRCTGWRPDTQD
jgi:hypothetical protein